MKYSHSVLKVAAAVTSVALMGVYVGYRVLRADPRTPAAVSPASTLPPEPPVIGPATDIEEPPLLHMGGSKSMIGVVEPADVRPKVLVPRVDPPKPDRPQK